MGRAIFTLSRKEINHLSCFFAISANSLLLNRFSQLLTHPCQLLTRHRFRLSPNVASSITKNNSLLNSTSMKTIILPSSMKAFFFPLIVLAASFPMQQVYGQATVLTHTPATTDHAAAKSSIGFQSAAFPIGNTGKVKVIFQDPTGKGATIAVRNKNGGIVYSKNYINKGSHKSNLDLSLLSDGEYAVEIVALTKAGFNKQKYTYTFQIKSTTTRSLTPVNEEMDERIFTPGNYQVSR
jgi:hypothetical protein